MPKQKDLRSIEDAAELAQSIKEPGKLKEVLGELTGPEQSLLFKAMGTKVIELIANNEEFLIINSLVKDPEEFRLHLLTHIKSDNALLHLLTDLKESLLSPLLLLGLTNPELVAQVRKDIIRMMRSFDTFIRYYGILLQFQIFNETEGHLFVRFIGDGILMFRDAEHYLEQPTACRFILNSYDYHQQHQNNLLQRVRRSYIGSFFIEQGPTLTLINPELLHNFYVQHAPRLIKEILDRRYIEPPINKLARLVIDSHSLLQVLDGLSTFEQRLRLITALEKRFFQVTNSAIYNKLYERLQNKRALFLDTIVSFINDKESLTDAINNHFILPKIIEERNTDLINKFRAQVNKIIQAEDDLQQLQLSPAMREGFEMFFAKEIASLKEEAALFRIK